MLSGLADLKKFCYIFTNFLQICKMWGCGDVVAPQSPNASTKRCRRQQSAETLKLSFTWSQRFTL